jgi:hypothetical protein
MLGHRNVRIVTHGVFGPAKTISVNRIRRINYGSMPATRRGMSRARLSGWTTKDKLVTLAFAIALFASMTLAHAQDYSTEISGLRPGQCIRSGYASVTCGPDVPAQVGRAAEPRSKRRHAW